MTIEISRLSGNIGARPEVKTTKPADPSKAPRSYYHFRLGVSHGTDPNRWTEWYTIRAFIDELSGDLLDKGQFVSVKGNLLKNRYNKADGSEAVEQVILANEVKVVPRKVAAEA